jgi:putative membrane protein
MNTDRDPRVYFAAERTMLAWIRTGLAMMGFGFVVARMPGSGGGSLWAGTALVMMGVIVNIYAAIAHRKFAERFNRAEPEPHDSRFGEIVASVLAAVGFAMAVYLIARG